LVEKVVLLRSSLPRQVTVRNSRGDDRLKFVSELGIGSSPLHIAVYVDFFRQYAEQTGTEVASGPVTPSPRTLSRDSLD